MSIANDPNRTSPDLRASNSIASQLFAFRIVGSLLQLLAISLCFELLLGITDGRGLILRFSLLAIIAYCVVLRLGWLALVALQVSLFFQEPTGQQFGQVLSGLFFVLVVMFAIVVAMKMPQTHRFVNDCFLRLFTIGFSYENSIISSQQNDSKRSPSFAVVSFAFHALQITSVVVLAMFLLTNLPIGRQSDSWLQWSLQNGQAVWPGTLLLVLMVGLLVLARESAWRQLEPSQASMYLRSVRFIANYRDLFGFERQRLKQLRKQHASTTRPSTESVTQSKMRNNNATDKNDFGGAG